jgi:flavin reductase (DIM6/NTAB) family NADH-FMN oxidoreductase RutF
VDNVVPYGTHSIVIGRVSAVVVGEGVSPLVYADGGLRSTQPLCAAD